MIERAGSGFAYRGMYRVDAAYQTRGVAGYVICRYELTAVDPSEARRSRVRRAPRRRSTINRLVPDTAAAGRVKNWHDFTCQVCGTTLELPGGPYAEGAHMIPLGGGHDGPDVESNILCLCPNDHVQFDRGAFSISDELKVIDHDGATLGPLHVDPRHLLDRDAIARHRELFGY